MFVLDTNELIYFSRGETAVTNFVLGSLERGEHFIISIVTLIEFLSHATITDTDKVFFHNILQRLRVSDLNYSLAMQAVELRKIYRLKLGDSIIAALALMNKATLVSRDKDFKKIKNLEVLDI